MCFMFGASEEQVRRVLEAAHPQAGDEEPGRDGFDRHTRHSSSFEPDEPP
ncbi:hypothetical protein [Lentzea sp. NBRC 102530]|nr:hypothetical protein [Lentzea sp. NBRC 102530]